MAVLPDRCISTTAQQEEMLSTAARIHSTDPIAIGYHMEPQVRPGEVIFLIDSFLENAHMRRERFAYFVDILSRIPEVVKRRPVEIRAA